MLLDDEIIAFLRAHEVRVIVSFDGADKVTFEKIRCGANFERISQNAAKLNRAYEDTPLDIAPASYTAIQRDNQSGLVEIVKVVAKLDFRRVGYGLVTGSKQFVPEVNQELLSELLSDYRMAGEYEMFLELFPTKVGAYVYSGDRYVSEDAFVVHTRCDAPLVNAVIRYDGAVCLCCNYGDVVGNVNDGSFLELWKSDTYDRLREAVNCKKRMPNACRNCWWVNR
jgi:radical SAM protein with 4Fe4S-binding SPASM domain